MKRTLQFAEGWLMLGDWRSAIAELDALPTGLRNQPEVLKLAIQAYTDGKDWPMAVRSAEALVNISPGDPAGWIHRSFALHEQKLTCEAYDQLEPALELFPTHWLIAYNMACYAAQLSDLAEARALLQRAVSCGDRKEIMKLLKEDPDLASLKDFAP